MISITDYDIICEEFKSVSGADGYVLSVTEEHLVNKLKDKKGIQLACVFPMLSTSGENGSFKDDTTALVMALEKHVEGQTDKNELKQYQRSQDVILKVRGHLISMAEDGCSYFNNLNFNDIVIEPIWISKGSWNGWSLEFNF